MNKTEDIKALVTSLQQAGQLPTKQCCLAAVLEQFLIQGLQDHKKWDRDRKYGREQRRLL